MAEAFHLARALYALDRLGVVEAIARPRAARLLALKFGLDRAVLEAALEVLTFRTDLITRTRDGYVLTAHCDEQARFLARQYLGAYGNVAMELDSILRKRVSGGTLVNRKEHARAFHAIRPQRTTALGDVVAQLRLNHVLDLGCGVAGLLLELSQRRRGFVGWGVERNPYMCRLARNGVAASPRAKRVRVYLGDCRRLDAVLPRAVMASVNVITAANVANEFCADRGSKIIEWLRHLRALFPGRLLLIADYYGQLCKTRAPRSPKVALHDWIQVISGQGIPPARRSDWSASYAAADCELLGAIEFEDSSFFVHLMRLTK